MFDVIVVGAGSAGAPLAARLSEDPRRRVLLLEAGRDWRSAEAPAEPAPTTITSYMAFNAFRHSRTGGIAEGAVFELHAMRGGRREPAPEGMPLAAR